MHTTRARGVTVADLANELNDELMRFVRVLKTTAPPEGGADRAALPLLLALVHDGPMRLRELAVAKGCDASTVSRQVAQLVGTGLVRRDPDPADRRACLLAVTDRGRGVCEHMIETRRRAIAEALRDWDPERLRTFTELFREFNLAVEASQATTPGFRTSTPPAGADDTRALAAG